MKKIRDGMDIAIGIIAGVGVALMVALIVMRLFYAVHPERDEMDAPHVEVVDHQAETVEDETKEASFTVTLAGFGSEYAENRNETKTSQPEPESAQQSLANGTHQRIAGNLLPLPKMPKLVHGVTETTKNGPETETEPDVTDDVMTVAMENEEVETEALTETTNTSIETEEQTETPAEAATNAPEEQTESPDEVATEEATGEIQTIFMEPGKTIDPVCGVFQGPWLKETYYNLNMNYCIEIMKWLGIGETYGCWVRSDGVKMYGDYIMCAADTNVFPKGSIVETSLGTAMVVDHCEAAEWCPEFDIAVTW
ncbi:hypothetical protein IKE87_00870 [Candidatus Saccharibacteria bacterium]|nr:hypothetical protein [Candidatus Saccharibacteria bacterium]